MHPLTTVLNSLMLLDAVYSKSVYLGVIIFRVSVQHFNYHLW